MIKLGWILFFCLILATQNPLSAQISLNFDMLKFETQSQEFQGKILKVRAYEDIPYVAKPIDAKAQTINIYIPEEYFQNQKNNGFDAKTAPIFFPNQVGGYMPSMAAKFVKSANKSPFPQSDAVLMAISKGFVVASAGTRGRIMKNGKAPAGIVDLKAAIRYLKYNDKSMPGDANKIISNGTSAGGAMSTLIGATGNHPDYEKYLKELGAAVAKDDIFAVSAYCPIINLENADMAYEWQFNGVNDYKKMVFSMQNGEFKRDLVSGTLDKESITVSDELKNVFPNYLNGLKLKNPKGELLSLDAYGDGNFKELVKTYIIASAQKAIDSGKDLSKHNFLKIENSKVLSIDFDAYVRYMERMKTPPAFDALDNSAPENQLFGNTTIDKRHFTAYSLQKSHSADSLMADKEQIKLMNPMGFIGDKSAQIAKHWRIRHGAKDKDTSLAIALLLATKLQNNGIAVDFAMPWDVPHSGDYDLVELFDWINKIVKEN